MVHFYASSLLHTAPPAGYPPLLLTSEPGSFARYTLAVRVPDILQDIIDSNDFPVDIIDALNTLRDEITSGSVRNLQEDAADRSFWDLANVPHVGKSWLDVPWYWAEAYLYRRVLEATGYFQPGPRQGADPYAVKKATEWQPDVAPQSVEALLDQLQGDVETRLRWLLKGSLWGNQADLCYAAVAELARQRRGARLDEQDAYLLVDDSSAIAGFLLEAATGKAPPSIAIVADNAGTELAMDLTLADYLLSTQLAGQVTFFLKPQPYFISDATIRDVFAGLQALSRGGPHTTLAAQRLWTHLDAGRLLLKTHWHFASSLFYFQLPEDLSSDLACHACVIFKGDANYRRLLGDAHWPATTPLALATSYFPAPLIMLRTLKSELVVGLETGQAARLAGEDPNWLVNGRYGVIQADLR
ncbi:MAG: damage-control phosphatase ARMT1 family protein [Chloroflexota bacterium]|nr:damage-control phosphatase ARMT1 family protein [Chloroflexota bacterium]